MTLADSIRRAAADLGLDACGFCARTDDQALAGRLEEAGPVPFAPPAAERLSWDAVLPGAASAIVCLFPYKPAEEEEGNIALYARPEDYHRVNRRYLLRLEERIAPLCPDARFAAITDTSPLADRWLAWRAGLGFFGTNRCLIHPKYGSLFTIGALLTTVELPPDAPMKGSCGNCGRCIEACPGHALQEDRFQPWTCRSYLTQKKEPLTEEEEAILRRTALLFGCDECQRVCPWNRKAAPSPLPETAAHRVASLSAEELDALSVRAFERKYKAYAFAWRGKKILARNLSILEKDNGQSGQ